MHVCEDCHSSCLDCWGPGPSNCTMCPTQAILDARGRCLRCCLHGNEEAGREGAAPQRECCNCTETRGGRGVGRAFLGLAGLKCL